MAGCRSSLLSGAGLRVSTSCGRNQSGASNPWSNPWSNPCPSLRLRKRRSSWRGYTPAALIHADQLAHARVQSIERPLTDSSECVCFVGVCSYLLAMWRELVPPGGRKAKHKEETQKHSIKLSIGACSGVIEWQRASSRGSHRLEKRALRASDA